MDLFKYTDPDNFLGGDVINGYDSAAWTERFRDPGDFVLVGKLSSGLKNLLPIGSFISHMRTLEVMMVENHQITEESDTDPEIKVTGRSLQAILEQRIVGQNQNWASPPASLSVSQYTLASQVTWLQATTLINQHIQTGTVVNANDAIPSLLASNDVSLSGVAEARTIARGDVLTRLNELLQVDEIGIKTVRRNNFPGVPTAGVNTTLVIHDGEDKRNTVVFSSRNGDIDVADYLWSIRKYKTGALITGKFVEHFLPGTPTGANRRILHVDGSDIDGHYETIPTGGTLTAVRAAMAVRGAQALKAQKRLALSRIDISSIPTYEYRRDYNIGDLVSVDCSFGEIAPMRVVEYTEIEDENGDSAQPSLEILEV